MPTAVLISTHFDVYIQLVQCNTSLVESGQPLLYELTDSIDDREVARWFVDTLAAI